MRMVRCISLPLALGLWLSCDWPGRARPAAPAPPPQVDTAQQATASAPAPAASAADQPPLQLGYAGSPAIGTKGVAIAPLTPYASGGPISSYRVSPRLPAGLSLDPATGVISGTPGAAAAAAEYAVTGSNSAGSSSTTVNLTVLDQAPAAPPVVTLPAFVTEAFPGRIASTPDLGKGTTYTWTLSEGTITAGQGTPSITFTPGGPGTLNAEVSVANSGGSRRGSAEAKVVPRPEATLTFPEWIRILSSAGRASVKAGPGLTYQWAVQAGTATASITSGQGTSAVGLTVGPSAGTFQIQVTITNQAGQAAIASGTIKVVAS